MLRYKEQTTTLLCKCTIFWKMWFLHLVNCIQKCFVILHTTISLCDICNYHNQHIYIMCTTCFRNPKLHHCNCRVFEFSTKLHLKPIDSFKTFRSTFLFTRNDSAFINLILQYLFHPIHFHFQASTKYIARISYSPLGK